VRNATCSHDLKTLHSFDTGKPIIFVYLNANASYISYMYANYLNAEIRRNVRNKAIIITDFSQNYSEFMDGSRMWAGANNIWKSFKVIHISSAS
jgi:hypothetical protein